MPIIYVSKIKCPECGFEKEELMPSGYCLYYYNCSNCKATLKSKEGTCCVFCSYGTNKCPSKQAEIIIKRNEGRTK